MAFVTNRQFGQINIPKIPNIQQIQVATKKAMQTIIKPVPKPVVADTSQATSVLKKPALTPFAKVALAKMEKIVTPGIIIPKAIKAAEVFQKSPSPVTPKPMPVVKPVSSVQEMMKKAMSTFTMPKVISPVLPKPQTPTTSVTTPVVVKTPTGMRIAKSVVKTPVALTGNVLMNPTLELISLRRKKLQEKQISTVTPTPIEYEGGTKTTLPYLEAQAKKIALQKQVTKQKKVVTTQPIPSMIPHISPILGKGIVGGRQTVETIAPGVAQPLGPFAKLFQGLVKKPKLMSPGMSVESPTVDMPSGGISTLVPSPVTDIIPTPMPLYPGSMPVEEPLAEDRIMQPVTEEGISPMLAGFPTWTWVLIAGAAAFMLLGKGGIEGIEGKGKSKRKRVKK